ncbi:MAG: hypothetical protein WBA10_20180 [Elainellaceae cyanobacterium]
MMVLRDDVVSSSMETNAYSDYGHTVANAQDIIFQYLLSIVKTWPAEDVLDEFKHLFIHHSTSGADSELLQALHAIAAANQEKQFKNTLKRSCYILINNWDISRDHQSIKQLVTLFSEPIIRQPSTRHIHNRLRKWLRNFVSSASFKELKLFVARYDDYERLHWSQRYTSYLLAAQYADKRNSTEQRQAAKALSCQLRDRFKVDLALYTAHSESASIVQSGDRLKDPTILGENSVQLIKQILAYQGSFGHEHLANVFRKQTAGMTYKHFKQALCTYLLESSTHEASALLRKHLQDKLTDIYPAYDNRSVDAALMLRTCNRIITSLTTEDHQNPSDIFLWVIAQETPLTIVLALLKLLLLSRNSRTHLETRIADLVQYYESYPEEECRWIINFFEMLNVTLAVHAEDVRYSLVDPNGTAASSPPSPEVCRIFSQLKHPQSLESNPLNNPFIYEPDYSEPDYSESDHSEPDDRPRDSAA